MIKMFEQDNPLTWLSVWRNRCDCHSRGIREIQLEKLSHPPFKLLKGIVRKIRSVETVPQVFPPECFQVHS